MNVYKILYASRSSPKIKVQGLSEGHVTFAFMWYLKKNTVKHHLATLIA